MQIFPVLSVKDSVVLPGSALPLKIGRSQSIAAVEAAQKNGNLILTLSQKGEFDETIIHPEQLRTVGTLSQIERIRGNARDGYQLYIRGVSRFKVEKLSERDGYIVASGDEWKDELDADPATFTTMLDVLKTMSLSILDLLPNDTRHIAEAVRGIDDLSYLAYLSAANMEIEDSKKQQMLETAGLKDRVLILLDLMQKHRDQLQIQAEVRDKLGHKMGKYQRETILREQLKTIQDELGDTTQAPEKENLRKKIEEAQMPEATQKVALDELKRLESMGPNSPESHMIRNYLDLLIALPWKKTASDAEIAHLDLEAAKDILNAEHYGLDKIKKRVLQHLAVMKLKKSSRGQILLLVGPPGVGKTSLGQSIAKAMNRKFVRGSLGGVRDDSEIRGHRRTYIGSMPGRIIQGIKRAGENNPVFMLDEIDKLGRGYSVDPAAALLEVLDPEQNSTFLDHYLDVPFDLSNVFFIATANLSLIHI